MAEQRTRRRFTAAFKAQPVKRRMEGGRGLAEVAIELGLSTGQPSNWRTEFLPAGSAEARAARKAEEAEMLRLKRELKRLEEENLGGFCQGDRLTKFALMSAERRNHAVATRCRESMQSRGVCSG